MKSSKDTILDYLKKNRGREVPVAEIKKEFGMELSTISNATKELHYHGLIELERRPLKRGRYTVIWLSGETITEEGRYVHEKEVISKGEEQAILKNASGTELDLQKVTDSVIDSFIVFLKSAGFDADEFQEIVAKLGLDALGLVTQLISPLLKKVGDQWAEGTLTTAEEHVISTRVSKYVSSRVIRQNGKKGTVIIAPVEGEQHTIPLVALEYVLTSYGYHIINIGHSVPVKSLIDYVMDLEKLPEWIMVSVTLGIYLGTLKRELKALKEEFGDSIRIAIGGQGLADSDRNSFPEAENVVISVKDLDNFLKKLVAKNK
ncbi:MAG: B12-binding domain-containing protein [Candidatus Odinarchaeota archaeon]